MIKSNLKMEAITTMFVIIQEDQSQSNVLIESTFEKKL